MHARASLQHTSRTKVMSFVDHGSQKGTKQFMSSKRLNFKEQRSQAWPRGILQWHAGYVLYEL